LLAHSSFSSALGTSIRLITLWSPASSAKRPQTIQMTLRVRTHSRSLSCFLRVRTVETSSKRSSLRSVAAKTGDMSEFLLKPEKNLTKKLTSATLYDCTASCIQQWSILFLRRDRKPYGSRRATSLSTMTQMSLNRSNLSNLADHPHQVQKLQHHPRCSPGHSSASHALLEASLSLRRYLQIRLKSTAQSKS